VISLVLLKRTGRAAAVMAVGDIVEPVEEWRKLKFEKLKRQWEYVFRRLFYTFTPDIRTTDFVAPVEIDTVEKTAGHIQNLDLYIDESGPVRNSTVGNVIQKGKISNGAGAAHLLYLKRPHQYSFIRDKYFPGQATTVHLEYVVIKGGKVLSRKTLAETPQDSKGLEPSFGRFHIGGDGALWVIAAGTYTDGAERTFGNYIGRILPGQSEPVFVRIDLKHPFRTFFTNTVRGGSEPADVIDLFGIADDSPNLRYAAIRLKSGK
jgi:hypothetical protein